MNRGAEPMPLAKTQARRATSRAFTQTALAMYPLSHPVPAVLEA
jgi:hypothetical protein